MSDATDTNVLHQLDKPWRFLIWTIDEIILSIVILAVGGVLFWVIGSPLVLIGDLVVVWGLVATYRKYKRKIGSTGGLAQSAYWFFPSAQGVSSSIREYIS